MRYFIVMIKVASRKEFPSVFMLRATSEQARTLEARVRRGFEDGKIKDFFFEPVTSSDAAEVSTSLRDMGI